MKDKATEKIFISLIGFFILAFLSISLTFFLNDMLDAYHGITIPGGDVEEPYIFLFLCALYVLAFFGFLIGYNGWFSRTENDKKRWYLIVVFGSLLPAYYISASWVHEGLSLSTISELGSKFSQETAKQAALRSQAILFCFFVFQATFGIWVDAMFRVFKPIDTGKNEAR